MNEVNQDHLVPIDRPVSNYRSPIETLVLPQTANGDTTRYVSKYRLPTELAPGVETIADLYVFQLPEIIKGTD